MEPMMAGDLVKLKLVTGEVFKRVRILSLGYSKDGFLEFEYEHPPCTVTNDPDEEYRFLVGPHAVSYIIPIKKP